MAVRWPYLLDRDLSISDPSRRRWRLPLVWPRRPRPRPPVRSLPGGGGGGGGVRAPGFGARLSRCPLQRVHSLPDPPSCHGPPSQAAARGAAGSFGAPGPLTDFFLLGPARLRAPPQLLPAVITPRPPRARDPGHPAAPTCLLLPGGGQHGGLRPLRRTQRSSRSPAARPGPARFALPSALLSRALLLSPRAEEGVQRGPRCRPPLRLPLLGRGLPLCLSPSLFLSWPPPPSRRGPPSPHPRCPLRTRWSGLWRGALCRGFPGTPPRVAPGGRPSRSEGCPGSPPRSQPPPGSAKRTSGMPRPHPAPLEGARPYLPSPSSAPRPGPGLGLRGWGGGREPDLTGAGRGRRPRPRTPGSYLLGGPWGWGPGRPGAAPLPEAGGVGGRAAAPAKL